MIRRIDLRGAEAPVDYRAAVPRAEFDVEAAIPAVHAICEAVRTRGEDAIGEYSLKFDGVEVADIRVPAGAMTAALEALDPWRRARTHTASCSPARVTRWRFRPPLRSPACSAT